MSLRDPSRLRMETHNPAGTFTSPIETPLTSAHASPCVTIAELWLRECGTHSARETDQFSSQIIGWPFRRATAHAVSHQLSGLSWGTSEKGCCLTPAKDVIRQVDPNPKASDLPADIARPDAKLAVLPHVTGDVHIHIQQEILTWLVAQTGLPGTRHQDPQNRLNLWLAEKCQHRRSGR